MGPNFVYFVVWSALIVGGWVVVSSIPDLRVGLCSLVCVEGLWMIKLVFAAFFPLVVDDTLGSHLYLY